MAIPFDDRETVDMLALLESVLYQKAAHVQVSTLFAYRQDVFEQINLAIVAAKMSWCAGQRSRASTASTAEDKPAH